MRVFVILSFLALFFASAQTFAQDTLSTKANDVKRDNPFKKQERGEYEPLAPAKAGFYSAILPGLGQAYNRSYWKIPLVYAGIGTSVYYYIENDKQLNKYRDAYKRRLVGHNDDEFQDRISDEGLIQAQKHFRKNKEISIFVAIGFYALNIIDANVDAHLRQFNVSEDLSVKPDYNFDQITGKSNYALSLNYKF